MEAFTYIWKNLTNKKKYVGYHKGREDDGYICSSHNDDFWTDFNNPENKWEREIVFRGLAKDAFEYEQKLLEGLKDNIHEFYNRGRQSTWIFTEDVLAKMRGRDTNGNKNGFFGKSHSSETKRKISRPGKLNSMFGRSAIAEQNLKWYTNGETTQLFPEGTQPDGFIFGRNDFVKSKEVECPSCKKIFSSRGMGRHIISCKKKVL